MSVARLDMMRSQWFAPAEMDIAGVVCVLTIRS